MAEDSGAGLVQRTLARWDRRNQDLLDLVGHRSRAEAPALPHTWRAPFRKVAGTEWVLLGGVALVMGVVSFGSGVWIGAVMLLPYGLAALWVGWRWFGVAIEADEHGLTIRNVLSTDRVRWCEVADVLVVDPEVAGRRRAALRLRSGAVVRLTALAAGQLGPLRPAAVGSHELLLLWQRTRHRQVDAHDLRAC